MNERCEYALTHPADTPDKVLDPQLSKLEPQPGGNLLATTLAVDR